jgi:hypothetical protein
MVENNTSQGPRGGCLGYGCLIALGILITVLSVIGYYILTSMRNAVDTYTSTSAAPFELSAAASTPMQNAVQGKVTELTRVLSDKGASGTFEFSKGEILAAVASSSLAKFAEIYPERGEIVARFSFKLSQLFQDSFASVLLGEAMDRYAFGSARGKIVLATGAITVELSELNLNGRSVESTALIAAAEWISGAITSAATDPQTLPTSGGAASGGTLLDRLSELSIADNTVIVSIKPAS